jgi:hypothetical protein
MVAMVKIYVAIAVPPLAQRRGARLEGARRSGWAEGFIRWMHGCLGLLPSAPSGLTTFVPLHTTMHTTRERCIRAPLAQAAALARPLPVGEPLSSPALRFSAPTLAVGQSAADARGALEIDVSICSRPTCCP